MLAAKKKIQDLVSRADPDVNVPKTLRDIEGEWELVLTTVPHGIFRSSPFFLAIQEAFEYAEDGSTYRGTEFVLLVFDCIIFELLVLFIAHCSLFIIVCMHYVPTVFSVVTYCTVLHGSCCRDHTNISYLLYFYEPYRTVTISHCPLFCNTRLRSRTVCVDVMCVMSYVSYFVLYRVSYCTVLHGSCYRDHINISYSLYFYELYRTVTISYCVLFCNTRSRSRTACVDVMCVMS